MSDIYDQIKAKKEATKYETDYSSSAVGEVRAQLGTIEKDASGHFGKFNAEQFRGRKIFDILSTKEFKTVLDVGAGALDATNEFIKSGHVVDICEFENSYYLDKAESKDSVRNVYIGDFNTMNIDNTYDAVWAAHILEHQLNPNIFLKKAFSLLNEGGYFAVVVPPRKPFVVGGHVSIWNGGLLLYHLILAGFDCSEAQLLQYDYNIGVVVKKKTIKESLNINYDIGDIDILKKYFPIDVTEGFNGDLIEVNV